MKKYIILTIVSFTIILTVFATGYSRVDNIEYLSAVRVEKTTAVESLIYSGTVEYANSQSCSSGGQGVVQSVLVSNGDYVREGDPILIAYQTESEVSTTDIMSAVTDGNYDEIYSLLGEESSIIAYNAPGSGIVSSLSLEENSVFQKGQTLFKISPENSFQIQINVTEKDISKVSVGQSVAVECKAIENALSGTVSSVDKSAKQTTTTTGKETTVKVVVTIDDECDDIKPGYTAECTINVSEAENTVLIPYSCITADENGEELVYLYDGERAEPHYIVCGKEYNNGVEVKAGLDVNDLILSEASNVENINRVVVNEVKSYEQ